MAIPDNPHFTQAELNRLNTAFRALGLSDEAREDIANYIGGSLTEQHIDAWQGNQPVQPTPRGPAFAPRWAEDFSRKEMIQTLHKRGITKDELRRYAAAQGTTFYARATKEEMIRALTRKQDTDGVGAILDFLRPRPVPAPVASLPREALPASIYLDQYLSSFRRGTEERRRADVVLALLSEVHQNPECTGGEDFELNPIKFFSIADAEEALIWPLRQGTATAPPLVSNPDYVNEAWNTVQLWRDPHGWNVTIWLYTAVSEDSNGMYQTGATGWPTRPTWGELRKMREDAREAERAARKKGKGR